MPTILESRIVNAIDQAADLEAAMQSLVGEFPDHRDSIVRCFEIANGEDAAPHELGHYRLIRRIGSGGMGVVYEAEHTETGRRTR